MKYKVAIFDFDGTLADSFPFMLTIVDRLADQYHLDRIDPDDISLLRKMHTRDLMRQFQVPMWKLPLIGRNVRALMLNNIHKITLFEGIDAVLQDLADLGVILVLVSSNSSEIIRQVLGGETASLFSHFECGSSIFGKKGRYKKVLKKFKVDPSEVISIGDEIRDMEASQKMNIPFGAVTWGFTDPEAFESYEPSHMFHSVHDIKLLLAGS
jgi:phosphoglycolate phosphatase